MSKTVKAVPTNKGGSEGGYRNGVPTKFVSRNLLPVKTAEAFVPTPAEPVRLRYKMAGGC
jgi:hypothetical protein